MSFSIEVLSHHPNTPSKLLVGDKTRPLQEKFGKVVVNLRGGITVTPRKPAKDGIRKTADQYGPIKEAFYSPYRLVYGTQGDDEETALNRNLANIASHHLCSEYRARSPEIVLPDTAVDDDLAASYNLVLYGRPSSNSVLAELQDDLPIRVENGTATIADQTYAGDLAVKYVYPNPIADDQLVQVNTGTTISGLRLTNTSTGDVDNGDHLDYQIYDDTVGTESWNGFLAAGFFDKHWRVSEELGEIRDIQTIS